MSNASFARGSARTRSTPLADAATLSRESPAVSTLRVGLRCPCGSAQLSHCGTLICIEAEPGPWSSHWVLTVDFTLPIAVIPQLRQYWQFNTDLSSVCVWGGFTLLALGNSLSAREGEQRNASP